MIEKDIFLMSIKRGNEKEGENGCILLGEEQWEEWGGSHPSANNQMIDGSSSSQIRTISILYQWPLATIKLPLLNDLVKRP